MTSIEQKHFATRFQRIIRSSTCKEKEKTPCKTSYCIHRVADFLEANAKEIKPSGWKMTLSHLAKTPYPQISQILDMVFLYYTSRNLGWLLDIAKAKKNEPFISYLRKKNVKTLSEIPGKWKKHSAPKPSFVFQVLQESYGSGTETEKTITVTGPLAEINSKNSGSETVPYDVEEITKKPS